MRNEKIGTTKVTRDRTSRARKIFLHQKKAVSREKLIPSKGDALKAIGEKKVTHLEQLSR